MPSIRRNLVAAAMGVVLALAVMAAFGVWLDDVVNSRGRDEVHMATRRAVWLAEMRIGRAMDAVRQLSDSHVTSCGASDIAALRLKTFSATTVKEMSVVGPQGQTLCSDVGLSHKGRQVRSTHALTWKSADYALEVLDLGDTSETMLRVRTNDAASNNVAALIPVELLLPQVAARGGPFRAFGSIDMPDGTTIYASGDRGIMKRPDHDIFSRHAMSPKFGFQLDFAIPRVQIEQGVAELRAAGLIIIGGLGVLVFVLGLVGLPRRGHNPEAALERGLRNGEFVPYYQPVVDMVTGKLLGAEVLMRWRLPDGTIRSPMSFIPMAESTGLILPMTRALMRQVRQELGPLAVGRPHLKISFNLSAQHLEGERIVKDVADVFAKGPIALSQVVLELTERQQIDNLAEARRVIASLQDMGVKIAIDDVGIGHGGLSYILKLGVDIIKIDKMFVDAIGIDRNSTTIVETLIDLAHNLRMDIVAEGVETFEQVSYLRERGIRMGQGYVFAPPLMGSSFIRLVEALDPIGEKNVAASSPQRAVA
jgi:sensor c-di-GMP phosphodiesterase-like protein